MEPKAYMPCRDYSDVHIPIDNDSLSGRSSIDGNEDIELITQNASINDELLLSTNETKTDRRYKRALVLIRRLEIVWAAYVGYAIFLFFSDVLIASIGLVMGICGFFGSRHINVWLIILYGGLSILLVFLTIYILAFNDTSTTYGLSVNGLSLPLWFVGTLLSCRYISFMTSLTEREKEQVLIQKGILKRN